MGRSRWIRAYVRPALRMEIIIRRCRNVNTARCGLCGLCPSRDAPCLHRAAAVRRESPARLAEPPRLGAAWLPTLGRAPLGASAAERVCCWSSTGAYSASVSTSDGSVDLGTSRKWLATVG